MKTPKKCLFKRRKLAIQYLIECHNEKKDILLYDFTFDNKKIVSKIPSIMSGVIFNYVRCYLQLCPELSQFEDQ